MPDSVYLIDGHAQIFRAYYARMGPLNAPSGEPTRATHVFWQMLLNLLRDRQPDYLAVVLDTSDETVFRRDIYPEYKAHRDPPPEDFPVQHDRIISMLEAARLPMLRKPGFEADDILATLAQQLAPDYEVFLVSKDKDLEQLLNERVRLFDPGKNLVITPDVLYETRGWRPEQAIDVQTLTGDTVDNVPGVKGIGPKTAAKLIAKYGSAQAVIEHADELTPKQRENVLAFAPQMDITRQLVTLKQDVEIDFNIAAAKPDRFDWAALRPIFEEVGFRRLTEQLPDGSGAESPSSTAATTPTDAPSASTSATTADTPRTGTATASPANIGGDWLAPDELRQPDGGQYKLVNTPEALAELAAQLRKQPAFAVDTETTGVEPVDAKLVGLSFAWEVGRGYYLPTRCVFGGELSLDLVRTHIAPILADASIGKIGQNLKYDLIVLQNAGMPVAGPLFDTMIAAFVIDPMQTSYKMDRLVARWFGHEMIPITDLIGKGRDQRRMDEVPLEHVAEYAAEDADYTFRLRELLEPQIRGTDYERLFFDTEMPLVSVLTDMELNGISIDVDELQRMSVDMTRRADSLVDEVHKLAGESFNLDSPKQLGAILFDKLGYRVVRKTKTSRSTDADTLQTLARESGDALPERIIEYREVQKLRSTYVDALPASRAKRTGRVHTSYHQTGAITGRLSSSEPNLQNIPVRTEAGRQIRRAFVPRTADELLIVADYSQIELRVLAHFCEDEQLIRAFCEDQDIHAYVAAQINGVELADVTSELRGRAKAVNFGIIYGQTAFGLAQGTGMSRGEAQHFIDEYFARYPRIAGFIQECIDAAKRDGYVTTMLGRRRPLPEIESRNATARAQAERLAVNTVIQGSAADLIKTAMIKLHARILDETLPLRMLLQVHDELVCEAPQQRADELAQLVANEMRTAVTLRAPIKVDVATGRNWLEAK